MHDYSWLLMTMHDYWWLFMTIHDYSWLFMTMHDYSWLFITIHDYSVVCMTVHDYSSLFTTTHHYSLLLITFLFIHHYSQLFNTIHHYGSLFITTHHYSSLFINHYSFVNSPFSLLFDVGVLGLDFVWHRAQVFRTWCREPLLSNSKIWQYCELWNPHGTRSNTQNEAGRFPNMRWNFQMIGSTIIRFKSNVWVEHEPGCGKFHSTWSKKSAQELWVAPPLGHNNFAWGCLEQPCLTVEFKGMPKVGITYMHVNACVHAKIHYLYIYIYYTIRCEFSSGLSTPIPIGNGTSMNQKNTTDLSRPTAPGFKDPPWDSGLRDESEILCRP